jgi:hypothetical protein
MIFSKRQQPAPARFTTEVCQTVRARILHTIPDLLRDSLRQHQPGSLYKEMGPRLLQQYGWLESSPVWSGDGLHPVVAHFLSCDDVKALDFVEMIFQSFYYRAGQAGVERINSIFREEGAGYELTPWRVVACGEGSLFGRPTGYPASRIVFPIIKKRGEEVLEEAAVRPALQVLADSRFATANAEMNKAHQHHRKGEDDDAITACGCAFESVLKTICAIKGWTYDANRAGCADLVKVCKDNGLFEGFYVPIFEATGTIRNKLGDAHGKGPRPLYAVKREHVEHAIQVTSAHIVLLVGLANL